MPDEPERETTEPGDPAAGLFAFFNEIGIISQLSRALFESRLPDGLLVAHFSVLNHLIRVGDGPTPLALARAFQVPKATMTHTLSGLVQRGYVEMRPNPKDGRSKQVWLTEAGRAFREEARQLLAGDIEVLAGRIDVGAVLGTLPVLEEVRRVLDSYRDEERDR